MKFCIGYWEQWIRKVLIAQIRDGQLWDKDRGLPIDAKIKELRFLCNTLNTLEAHLRKIFELFV